MTTTIATTTTTTIATTTTTTITRTTKGIEGKGKSNT